MYPGEVYNPANSLNIPPPIITFKLNNLFIPTNDNQSTTGVSSEAASPPDSPTLAIPDNHVLIPNIQENNELLKKLDGWNQNGKHVRVVQFLKETGLNFQKMGLFYSSSYEFCCAFALMGIKKYDLASEIAYPLFESWNGEKGYKSFDWPVEEDKCFRELDKRIEDLKKACDNACSAMSNPPKNAEVVGKLSHGVKESSTEIIEKKDCGGGGGGEEKSSEPDGRPPFILGMKNKRASGGTL